MLLSVYLGMCLSAYVFFEISHVVNTSEPVKKITLSQQALPRFCLTTA